MSPASLSNIATHRSRVRMFSVSALLALSLGPFGCNSKPSANAPAAGTTKSQPAAEAGFECEDKLEIALEMVRPDRLGLSTDPQTGVSRLNTWLDACGGGIEVASPPAEQFRPLLEPVLSRIQLGRLASENFVPGDAEHVRNCLVHKAAATLPLNGPTGNLARAVELFHYCVRNVALHASPEENVPLNPFEILLYGRGSAADLAWVYADVLRQLQIDAVILRPSRSDTQADPPGELDDRLLIGVLLDDKVYLFDPRLGTPIPAAADDPMNAVVRQPATLAAVLKDDTPLRRLDLSEGQTYPLAADDLKNPLVEIIGTPSQWTAPMAKLQASLAGERLAVVYDGLQDFGDSPGLLSRVAAAGNGRWERDQIRIWSHPARQLEAGKKLDDAQRARMTFLETPLDAPVPVEVDQVAGRFHYGSPERRCLKTRLMFLMGDFDDAIRNFQGYRIQIGMLSARRIQLPPEYQTMHDRAADDAAYWIGLCQIEQGKFGPAAGTFRGYLKRFEKQPQAAWTPHCRLMYAYCLAETGERDEAVYQLRPANEMPAPLEGRRQFLLRRWQPAAPAAE